MNSLATYEFQSNRWWQQQAMHTPLTGSPEFARHRSAKSVAQPQRCLLRATNDCKTNQVGSIVKIINLWCKCCGSLANFEFTMSPLHCSTRGTCWSERSAMSILILSVESSLAWNCEKNLGCSLFQQYAATNEINLPHSSTCCPSCAVDCPCRQAQI